ncbi:MAG TPA: porin family protein [Bacteroidales bacterium]|jgi:hypothetical protein|nr:porin family protein [Bacteroidales bacterium]
MKRLALYLFLVLMTLNDPIAEGQSKYYHRQQPVSGYGIKAGINYAGQSTSNKAAEVSSSEIMGINAGGYFNYFFLGSVAVQAEFLVSGKGSHWKDYYDEAKDIVSYIDLPVMIRYQPIKFMNVHAGPQAGMRLGAKQKDMKTGIKADIKDYYKTFDFGFVFGAEADLPYNLNITLRYIMGISPATTSVRYVDPWMNNLFQISLGCRLAGK